jgi:hypothetical protein
LSLVQFSNGFAVRGMYNLCLDVAPTFT